MSVIGSGLRLLATLFVVSLAAATAHAQSPRDAGERLLIEKRQNELKEKAKAGKAGADVSVTAPAPQAAAPDQCFPIKLVEIESANLLTTAEIHAVIDAHAKSCMDVKAIEAMLMAFNKIYVERGYVTARAMLPEQDLESGTLQVKVVEGRVEKITYLESRDGKKAPGPQSKIATSFPLTPGERLQLRNLEQGLDQINRLPSNKATIDIKPGEAFGTSELVVSNEMKSPYRVGSKFTYLDNKGRTDKSADVTIEADDLFKVNDMWYLAYSGGSSSNALSVLASLPYGWWTLSASGSYSEDLQHITTTSDLYTQTATGSFILNRMLFRDAKQKVKAEVSYSQRWNSRYINASRLTPHRFSLVRAGMSYEKYLTGGFLSLGGGVSSGLGLIGGEDSDVNGAPQANFYKADVNGLYYHAFANGATATLSATLQWSSDVLYNSEQMTIGGSTSVRGYSRNKLSGDTGGFMQTTLNFPMTTIAGDPKQLDAALGPTVAAYVAPLTPYVFFDAGTVVDRARDTKSGIAAAGIGIGYSKDRVSADIYAALPLVETGSLTSRTPEFRASVTIKLY